MRPALVAYALSQPWQKKVHQKAPAEEGKAILFCSISFSPQRLKRVYSMYIIRRPLTRNHYQLSSFNSQNILQNGVPAQVVKLASFLLADVVLAVQGRRAWSNVKQVTSRKHSL